MIAWLLVACAAPPGPSGSSAAPRVSLVAADAWDLVVDPADDPWGALRPDDAECPARAWDVEGDTFEVDTGSCTWGTFWQPAALGVRAGMPVDLVVWHLDLWAPEPATGLAGIALDGEIIWEETAEIPGDEAIWSATVTAPRDVPAGAPVTFHVHNHGTNAWRISELSVEFGWDDLGVNL